MTIRVFTPETGFVQDMADVLRLFYGGAPIFFNEEGEADLRVEHAVSRQNGHWCDQFSGGPVSVFRLQGADGAGELEQKRLRKRAVKLALYEYCKKLTGVHPPWGSLTGIRPSRLYYEALEEGLDPVRALVDVFDVTEDRAQLLDEMHDMQVGVRTPPEGAFDIYIGIPFCKTRCAYCSFSSGEIGDGHLVAPYVEALKREIALSARIVAEKGLRARALYVGGGTPTAIPREALEEIIFAAREAFPGAVEQTVEAGRPDTITREKLEVLRAHGVGRVSINPQTLEDQVLRAIGRRHTAEDIYGAFALAREVGFEEINMDLIAGLPRDSYGGFCRTLEGVLAMAPENITVHTLALKKGSALMEKGGPLPSGEETARMLEFSLDALEGGGYEPYYLYRQKYMSGSLENVGWTRPGRGSLYNIAMMEELHTVVSVGGGGITKLVDPAAGRILRLPNPKYPQDYLSSLDKVLAQKEELVRFYAGARPR